MPSQLVLLCHLDREHIVTRAAIAITLILAGQLNALGYGTPTHLQIIGAFDGLVISGGRYLIFAGL
jgi:hypothetical protein